MSAAAGDSKLPVIKNGAQSVSYLWSVKFFLAYLLFVLNVIFTGFLKENEQRENGPIV